MDFCPYVASASYILEACSALVLYHSFVDALGHDAQPQQAMERLQEAMAIG